LPPHHGALFPQDSPNIEGGYFEKSFIARDIVPTLYELLGALPLDDADGLRTAFRKAAKASHPDNNPTDPEAPQRFRQIVRAHSILRDERQRAAYDWLLTAAEQQQTPDSRRKAFFGVGLPGPIGSMVIASVSIGAFVALERVFTTPAVPAPMPEISAQVSALTAAAPAEAPITVGRASERDKPAIIASIQLPEIPKAVEERPAPAVTAATDAAATGGDEPAAPALSESDVSEPAISKPAVKDATYYRERGSRAYRSGDFPLALIDFDLALNLDPNSSDTYVNRAIVFRRMGDLKRAFADVNQARRIDEDKHH
jgi:curved DNA-binding protein CbpA